MKSEEFAGTDSAVRRTMCPIVKCLCLPRLNTAAIKEVVKFIRVLYC